MTGWSTSTLRCPGNAKDSGRVLPRAEAEVNGIGSSCLSASSGFSVLLLLCLWAVTCSQFSSLCGGADDWSWWNWVSRAFCLSQASFTKPPWPPRTYLLPALFAAPFCGGAEARLPSMNMCLHLLFWDSEGAVNKLSSPRRHSPLTWSSSSPWCCPTGCWLISLWGTATEYQQEHQHDQQLERQQEQRQGHQESQVWQRHHHHLSSSSSSDMVS